MVCFLKVREKEIMRLTNIRNFAIIAHIDHGKSTLADRIMEMTQTVNSREKKAQLLDDMEVEQAHGITVKSRTVRNYYKGDDGCEYEYNFIDTPGHVDFAYEVSKSLAACDGVLLLVDATQGVQAQTVANFRLAKENHLTIIPIVNKIDSEKADVEKTERQIKKLDTVFEGQDFLHVSAKTGQGVHAVLEAIYRKIPAPTGKKQGPLKALIFDSVYDPFKGVIAYVRIFDGQIRANNNLKVMSSKQNFTASTIGVLAPNMQTAESLNVGDVGYVVTGIKNPKAINVGDTLTSEKNPTESAFPGYRRAKSMVFAGFYPKNNDYVRLKSAIERLSLNDSSFQYVLETSDALGMGFRCGFLGMLHLQIVRERLKDEYDLEVLTTSPNVTYHVHIKDNQKVEEINNPAQFPNFSEIEFVEEPFVRATITTPAESVSQVMKLAEQSKGNLQDLDNKSDLVVLKYDMPLSEIAYNFFSKLKSISHGYADLDTSFLNYQIADIVKVEVHINYARVDALSFAIHRQDVPKASQNLVKKLKYSIPRKLYPMPAQVVVEGKSVARVDIPPLRKNAAVNGEKRSVSKKKALLRRQNVNKRQAAQSDIKLTQEVFNSILELK